MQASAAATGPTALRTPRGRRGGGDRSFGRTSCCAPKPPAALPCFGICCRAAAGGRLHRPRRQGATQGAPAALPCRRGSAQGCNGGSGGGGSSGSNAAAAARQQQHLQRGCYSRSERLTMTVASRAPPASAAVWRQAGVRQRLGLAAGGAGGGSRTGPGRSGRDANAPPTDICRSSRGARSRAAWRFTPAPEWHGPAGDSHCRPFRSTCPLAVARPACATGAVHAPSSMPHPAQLNGLASRPSRAAPSTRLY